MSIANWEGNIYDILLETSRQETPNNHVVCANHNRFNSQRDPAFETSMCIKVRDEVPKSEVVVVQEITMPQIPQREPRSARLEICEQKLTMNPIMTP